MPSVRYGVAIFGSKPDHPQRPPAEATLTLLPAGVQHTARLTSYRYQPSCVYLTRAAELKRLLAAGTGDELRFRPLGLGAASVELVRPAAAAGAAQEGGGRRQEEQQEEEQEEEEQQEEQEQQGAEAAAAASLPCSSPGATSIVPPAGTSPASASVAQAAAALPDGGALEGDEGAMLVAVSDLLGRLEGEQQQSSNAGLARSLSCMSPGRPKLLPTPTPATA